MTHRDRRGDWLELRRERHKKNRPPVPERTPTAPRIGSRGYCEGCHAPIRECECDHDAP